MYWKGQNTSFSQVTGLEDEGNRFALPYLICRTIHSGSSGSSCVVLDAADDGLLTYRSNQGHLLFLPLQIQDSPKWNDQFLLVAN